MHVLCSAAESRLDILINNAGLFTMDRRETEDGFELHMGTNHLGMEELIFDVECTNHACYTASLQVRTRTKFCW